MNVILAKSISQDYENNSYCTQGVCRFRAFIQVKQISYQFYYHHTVHLSLLNLQNIGSHVLVICFV